MNAIVTKGLTKKFGEFIAVNNIDLEVGNGEIFGFLGANGDGENDNNQDVGRACYPRQAVQFLSLA